MADDALTLAGWRELRKSLKAAGDDLSDLRAVNLGAAEIAAEASADLAPIGLTGKLRATIRASGTKVAGIIRAGTTRVRYVGPVHWGWFTRRGQIRATSSTGHRFRTTRTIKANPFLSQGAQDSEGQWLPLYSDYTQKIITNIKGR